MQSKQSPVFGTGRRVQGFLDAQAATVGDIVPAALRAELDDGVAKGAAFELAQGASSSAAKGETARQQLIRDDLYARFIHPIDGIAKKKLKGQVSVTELASLIISSAFRHSNTLLTKATELADAAAKYEKTFIDNGLPADFIAQLRAGIAEITASEAARVRQLSRRAAATTGIATADKAVRDTIDSMKRVLKPALKTNPALLSDWMASKRIKQPAVTPIPTGSVNTSAGPATPTTPASPPGFAQRPRRLLRE